MGAADRSREADDACRHRLTQAIAELAHERRLGTASIDGLCRRAVVPRADFDRLFRSLPEALRNAFAEAFGNLFDPVGGAVASAPTWLDGLAKGLDALLEGASSEPRLAELCLVHSPEAPEESAGHDYRAAVETVSALVHTARVHAGEGGQQAIATPPLAEEFLAHGILFTAVQIATREDEPPTLQARRMDLLMLVLMTFYGTADAARLCTEVEV